MALSNESIYILRKLYSWSRWGGCYVNKKKVFHTFPRHKRDGTLFNEWLKELFNEGLIIIHKKGETISLDSQQKKRIEEIVNRD